VKWEAGSPPDILLCWAILGSREAGGGGVTEPAPLLRINGAEMGLLYTFIFQAQSLSTRCLSVTLTEF